MVALLRTDHVPRRRGMLALLMFGVFDIFWSALAFEPARPPHARSHTATGAFGTVGGSRTRPAHHAGRAGAVVCQLAAAGVRTASG
jgi:hypothetical protein